MQQLATVYKTGFTTAWSL